MSKFNRKISFTKSLIFSTICIENRGAYNEKENIYICNCSIYIYYCFISNFKFKKSGLFAAGVLFGTAGIKILTSDDAKKLYTNCTAAVLRAKSCVMKTATSVQENAGDILAEAKQINEDRAAEAEAEVVDDFCETEETAEDTAEATEE